MSDMFAEMELAAQRDCKQAEIERLSEENTLLAEAAQCVNELRSRLAQAEALLREIREDAPHFGMPTTRINAFLAPDSATVFRKDGGIRKARSPEHYHKMAEARKRGD